MKTRILRATILGLMMLLVVPWFTNLGHSSGITGTVCVEPSGTAGCGATLPFGGAPESWSSPTLIPSPSMRKGASMVYDSADGYVLLFGGYDGTYLGDTWKFSGGTWTHLSPSLSPSARADSAMVYDSADGYMLLFGGYNGVAYQSDTWRFFGGSWSTLSPTRSPLARSDASVAYDAIDRYVLLFGGYNGVAYQSDTWRFSSGSWTQLSPSSSPSARTGASAAYDSADSYVLLFGGYNGVAYQSDTWRFSSGSWTQLSPSSSPALRAYSAMAYDYGDGVVLLFGGYNVGFLSDTWTFTGGYWLQLPSSAPPPRSYSSIAYDQGDGYVLLFGGLIAAAGYVNDSWELLPFTLSVAVNISGSDIFNAFDIILLVGNRGVLIPAGVDVTGSILATSGVECIGTTVVSGPCPSWWNTPSTIELALGPTSYCGLSSSCDGLLFTAKYIIVGGATTIGFQTGCYQSSNPGTCVTVANGRNDPPENFAGATFNDLSSTSAALFTSTGMSIPDGGNVPTGTSVYDTARVAVSGISPTGTVTYAFFSNNACSGAGSPQTVTMSGGLAPNSTTQMSLGPGNYGFLANYSGDRNYNASRSLCESFMVPGPAVGGTIVPIDQLMLLAPFIGLGLLTSAGIWVAVMVKRSRTRRSATQVKGRRLLRDSCFL